MMPFTPNNASFDRPDNQGSGFASASPAHGNENRPTAASLAERLFDTRARSVKLAEPLSPEDMTVQASDDASPTKWHLAHVTWFFENFVLAPYLDGYRIFDDDFNYCFNSYYEALGPRHPRARRGLLTRPSAERILAYRQHVDEALRRLLDKGDEQGEISRLLEIGINHEQQHQELLLTDILALFAANPLRPAYQAVTLAQTDANALADALGWLDVDGGILAIGNEGEGYSWDNELPAHDALVRPFRFADRLVSNAEWLNFIEDGGYQTASLWLADGWATVNREAWDSPLYWHKTDGGWAQMSLQGLHPIVLAEPVAHVSYYEADAFARWAGKRLPTEFEWEAVARAHPDLPARNADVYRPYAADPIEDGGASRPRQLFGEVWQWTASAYLAYPGYRPPKGAIGEYNGKFMVGQHVLRGSSCVTPPGHSRPAYRNFFYPHQRWQYLGLRLAAEFD